MQSKCPALLAALLVAGCSRGPQRIKPPAIDAAAAARAAIEQYDTNRDGAISGDELDRVPGLRVAITQYDTNPQDGQITADEIQARIEQWSHSRMALMPLDVEVRLDGRPLAGATVTLEPEAFLGDAVRPATAITAHNGVGALSIAEAYRPAPSVAGVHCGIYKIRVSRPRGRAETAEASYAAETTLGCEIAPDARQIQNGVLRLKLTRS